MSAFSRGLYDEEVERLLDPYLFEIERLRPALTALPARHDANSRCVRIVDRSVRTRIASHLTISGQ